MDPLLPHPQPTNTGPWGTVPQDLCLLGKNPCQPTSMSEVWMGKRKLKVHGWDDYLHFIIYTITDCTSLKKKKSIIVTNSTQMTFIPFALLPPTPRTSSSSSAALLGNLKSNISTIISISSLLGLTSPIPLLFD